MKRTELKQIRTLLAKQPIKGSPAPTNAIVAKASEQLKAVVDTYETANMAGELIRAQLAYAESPKDIAVLTRALRDVMGIQAEARQEGRDTIEALSQSRAQPDGTDPGGEP